MSHICNKYAILLDFITVSLILKHFHIMKAKWLNVYCIHIKWRFSMYHLPIKNVTALGMPTAGTDSQVDNAGPARDGK